VDGYPPSEDANEASDADPGAAAGGQPGDETEVPPASLSGVVTRGAGLAGTGYVFSQLLTFAAYLVLARLATPADFGLFAAGSLVVGVGAVIGESGIEAALIQRRQRLEQALNAAFLATLAGGVALTFLALATAPLVQLFFHNHQAGVVAAVMSGSLLLRLMTIVPDALLMRRFSFMRRVVIDPLSTIAFAAGSIPAAAAGWGVWSLVIGTYASILSTLIGGWVFAGWRPRLREASLDTWRELARFGRPVMAGNLIRSFVLQIPVLALGRVSGPSALGQFTYASRTANQPLGAVVNVGGYVLLPAFSRLSAFDARFRAAVCKALRWLCAISFPACMLLLPLGAPAVVLVFGQRWRPAGHAVMILSVYSAALSLDSIASEAWKASARTDMLPRMHGLSLLLTAALVGALVVPFGLVGVAVGMSVSAAGVAAFAVRGMSHALGIRLGDLVHELWPPAVAAGVMAAGLFCLEHFVVRADLHGTFAGLLLLALESLVGAAIYLAMMAVFAPETTRELLGRVRRLSAWLRDRRRVQPDGAA
jgi:O-antigen/teichoic acid export membrane protein